jgi:thiamine pyrophosphokinase
VRVFVIAGSPDGQPPAAMAPGPGDRVIAADYGAHHAHAWGWPVHLLVGDLDSLPADEAAALQAEGTPVIIAPQAKDETDLELALAEALDLGAVEIVICAALGGRTDHLLANVLLLARPELAGMEAVIADGPVTIHLLRGGWGAAGEQGRAGAEETSSPAVRGDGEDERTHLALHGAAGDLLSLLPVGGNASGVTTRGLVYPLRDETLDLGQGRGVSNVFESATAHVWLRAGLLLVVHTQTGPGNREPMTGDGIRVGGRLLD